MATKAQNKSAWYDLSSFFGSLVAKIFSRTGPLIPILIARSNGLLKTLRFLRHGSLNLI